MARRIKRHSKGLCVGLSLNNPVFLEQSTQPQQPSRTMVVRTNEPSIQSQLTPVERHFCRRERHKMKKRLASKQETGRGALPDSAESELVAIAAALDIKDTHSCDKLAQPSIPENWYDIPSEEDEPGAAMPGSNLNNVRCCDRTVRNGPVK
jgi:hypothetical protein